MGIGLFLLLAVLLGGLVGAGELVSRYRDDPSSAFSKPGWAYIALNVLASVGAFLLARTFGWRFGIDGTADGADLRTTQLLVSGFGAIALFRTSLFTVKAGDKDIGIGPSALLTVALGAADRQVDRDRARHRSAEVVEAMSGISFEKSAAALPLYCFQIAMQNVSREEQLTVGNVVNTLKTTSTVSDRIKAYVLGAALLTVVGYEVLQDAVAALGDEIKN